MFRLRRSELELAPAIACARWQSGKRVLACDTGGKDATRARLSLPNKEKGSVGGVHATGKADAKAAASCVEWPPTR